MPRSITNKEPQWHPKLDDKGRKVRVDYPSQATNGASWIDPASIATVVAGGQVPPSELNGIAFVSWSDVPTSVPEWADVPGQNLQLDEPEFKCPRYLRAAAGVVIEEDDGRVWLVSPTNAFGGYRNTFPKGRLDEGLRLQATAIKEAYEESGLRVRIDGWVGDFPRSQTYTRFYRARRVGGTPANMGWESQAVHLVPWGDLSGLLNVETDRAVLAYLYRLRGHAGETSR